MSTWYWNGLDAIRKLAQEGEPFTSDDIHRLVGDPPHHNQMGRLFGRAQEMNLIRHTGRWVQSKRPASKGRRISEWEAGESPQEALL